MYKSNNLKINRTKSSFSELYEIFESYNKARNLSAATIKTYAAFKNQLVEFMGGDFDVKAFTGEKIKEYILAMQKRGNKAVSINTKLRHLKAMFNFFAKQGYCEPPQIQMLKAEVQAKRGYSDAELELLLKKPNLKTCGWDDYRNYCIICYALSTGNRTSTIINLRMGDINFQQDEIYLRHTKNRKQQIIPLGSALKGVLIEYMKYRQAESEEDFLFSTWHGEQLTNHGIRNAIYRYNRRHGVQRTSLHQFRNTFVRKYLENGGDILRLKELLGHSSLRMVQQYAALYGSDLKRDYDRLNPLTNFANQKKHLKLR